MAIFYRILQVIAVAALTLLLWFFFVGVSDGSIDDNNLMLWIILLAVPSAALLLSLHLWKAGQRTAACVLLAVPAAPAVLYGMFVALFIIAQPRF